MRLFIGLELGDDTRERCADLIGELRDRARRLAPTARITWAAPDRLHVTVRFIGDVEPATAGTIAEALAPPLDVPPFDLIAHGAGSFPPRGKPKVLWAGLSGGRSEAAAIARRIAGRLDPILGTAEERGYNPHVTLARIREAAGLRTGDVLKGLEDLDLGTTRVDAVTLFESRLSPNGPSYVPLVRVALV
jgi:2'-5' RNA ligase